VDFAGATEDARAIINEWVGKETNHKIPELFARGTLDASYVMALTNAIHFKADWAQKFDAAATRDEPFKTGAGEVLVPTMHQTGSFGYLDAGTFQALELLYAGNELSMVVLLPKEAAGLAALEKSLTSEALSGWTDKLSVQSVVVSLPRFTMTSGFDLEKPLVKMGMPAAFDAGAADFSGMNGKRDLYIGIVVHKAFVEVNEAGTEATGATGVGIGKTNLGPRTFKADHPFLFVIRDTRNGGILFMGRVASPATS
jgi:serpin B